MDLYNTRVLCTCEEGFLMKYVLSAIIGESIAFNDRMKRNSLKPGF